MSTEENSTADNRTFDRRYVKGGQYALNRVVRLAVPILIIRELNALRFIFGMSVKKEKSITRFFKKKKTTTDESVIDESLNKKSQ